jgi:hypothetical protein
MAAHPMTAATRPPAKPWHTADDSTAITLREQKRSIARQLVIAQETLSRSFRRQVDLGCIDIKGDVVTVRDLRALQLLAGSLAGSLAASPTA